MGEQEIDRLTQARVALRDGHPEWAQVHSLIAIAERLDRLAGSLDALLDQLDQDHVRVRVLDGPWRD